MQDFDVLVVGGGIAGVTAAIYLKRSGKNVAVIERSSLGGQIITAHKVENYPLVLSTSGYEIADKLQEQVDMLKIELIYDNITSFDLYANKKTLKGNNGTYRAEFVILAMGSAPKPLGLDKEDKLVGSGVSYCTTCDGAFFKGREVLVAGVSGHALSSVNYLAPIASKVHVVVPKALPKTEFDNVVVHAAFKVTSLLGEPLSGVVIEDESGKTKELKVEGLFVASGNAPATQSLAGVIDLDERGYIITDDNMKTNISGVLAVGDIRKKQLRQLVTAASDGAIAAVNCKK